MTNYCDDCGFLFHRLFRAECCPICGSRRVRRATEPEYAKLSIFLARQAEQPCADEEGPPRAEQENGILRIHG